MSTALQVLLIALSFGGTLFAWRTIHESNDPLWAKVLLALLAAIPVLGPIMWLFTAAMPPRRAGHGRVFQGPIAQNATSPRWAARSYKVLAYLAAAFVLAVHALLLAYVAQ
jgi:hypothetical protein